MGSFGGGGGRDQMTQNTAFVQKLLDDIRLRKEKMGLVTQSRSPPPPSTALAATGYKNSRRPATVGSNYNSNRNRTPSLEAGSRELVPFGGRNASQHSIDMSTALALALNSSGKIHNIEILSNPTMGRKIVLHMDCNTKTPCPSPYPFRIGEVAKGVKNLTMILEVCSNKGYNLSRDSIEFGRELLKGAMDLEESLKLLATLQEASYSLTNSQGKHHLKLLKGKEDGDEESRRGNQHKAASRSKFSFIREIRSTSDNEKSRRPVANNTDKNSSKTSMQSIKGCSDLKPEAPPVSHGSHEPVRFSTQSQVSSKANPASQKVRIPNVIAKLMGLEELPAPAEEKSADAWCRTRSSLPLKEMSDKVVEIDEDNKKKLENSIKRIQGVGEQEKVVNDIAKSGFRRCRISDDNRSPASKDLKNACAGKYGQMVLNNQTKTGVRKEGVPQEETKITERQIEGRSEHVIPLVGNYLPEYVANNIRVRKRNVTVDGEENVQQQTKEKIDASVKMIDSEKRTLSMLNAKHENQGKKKLILIKEELGYDMRTMRGQSGKEERVYSNNNKGSVSRTASQPPKENIKTCMTNKNIHNKHRGKKVIEQISEKRLPLNRDTREEMARTSIQAKVMRKPTVHNQSLQKLNDLIKISERVVQVPVQNKALDARQSMDRRRCVIELESRWKERNKKVEGAENCEDDSMGIANCNPFTGEETKTAACRNLATGGENIQDSMDQPIHEEIKVKSQEENSVSRIAERSCITMTECVEECSGEDVKEKCEEAQSIENKEEATNPSRLMQLDGNYIACQDWTMEVDQQVLTEHEDALKQKLITSQNFLNIAQSLFQIKVHVDILQENVSPHKHSRLVVDCGNEILRRKGQREEVSFSGKSFLAPLKRSIDALIKEVNVDLESLKCENNTCDYDLADCLNKMIENDIHQRDPDINCLWDIGWDNKTFVCFEKREIVKDVEKHLLNGLLNELTRELLHVSFSSL